MAQLRAGEQQIYARTDLLHARPALQQRSTADTILYARQRPALQQRSTAEAILYATTQRNPFDSPNLSMSSLNETDGGSTSEQDEFHLERYGSNAKHKHLRQVSRNTKGEETDKKPDLNIVTDFSGPNMPMKSGKVMVNEVPAKQVRADRKNKASSVVSHKAIRSAVSPPDEEKKSSQFLSNSRKRQQSKGSKRERPLQKLHEAIIKKQKSPFTQRIPIGITIPQEDAARIDQTATDSALHAATPMTPGIMVTSAGDQQSWVLQPRGAEEMNRPASSIYSAMPTEKPHNGLDHVSLLPHVVNAEDDEKSGYRAPRSSYESGTPILSDSADTARPKSQGWWNLMLSPLLRAGSLASKKGVKATDTPPVPPLPFATEKNDSPALSARSDPSFMISPDDTSPDTPRRQGLASARASTWSRWTEWEQQREEHNKRGLDDEAVVCERALEDEDTQNGLENNAAQQPTAALASTGTGLAAEYFHACAVEQVMGRPYFECINHSCAEQLPKLRSIHDTDGARGAVLASPFQSPLVQSSDVVEENARSQLSPDRDDNLSPNELSPNVREASIAPMLKATALDNSHDKGTDTKAADSPAPEQVPDKVPSSPPETMAVAQPATTYSAPRNNGDELPSITTVSPPPQVVEVKVVHEGLQGPVPSQSHSEKALVADTASVTSPVPMSPEGQKSMAPMDAVPLSEIGQKQPNYPPPVVFNNYAHHGSLPGRPAFITAETEYPPFPARQPTAPVTAADLEATNRRLSIEERRQRHEKEDATAKKVGSLWRGRGCFPKNGCMGRGGPENRTKRRWIIGIAVGLLAIIVACVVLALTLTRRGDGTPVDGQWLNLTGYPPMPTGILTIAAPNLASSQKQCVEPSTMWSCSVPKEDRDEIGTNEPDQPNFRFEIRFRNGTVPSNMTIPLQNNRSGRNKAAKDPFTNDLFVANPQPPPQLEQVFLGQTTDNITVPYEGEVTPFYVTFLSAFPVVPSAFDNDGSPSSKERLVRRQSDNSTLLKALPAPALADDGSAANASLLPTTPYLISQPVRLYNRGLQDEHYGSYNYYDKSIYLSGVQIGDGQMSGSSAVVEADQNGGSTKAQATARCTFAQTRFLFKIYTSTAFSGALLPGLVNANLTHPDDAKKGDKNKTSSATDFERPGSFPYPASIVLDRHGGKIDDKVAYCYGMSDGQILTDQKTIVGEQRNFGGVLINPAPTVLENQDDFNSTAGGIDGGTGGCGCTWRNFQ
ncbi:hypothetical protein LTR70_006791 [Exophiala xenobiotica]|uniref:Glycoprotease family protein n=1 Tax=Lithohypha guttulata TaxID=1690604 RepID=A0ABR0K669_9EURO|nr:hypothetical protein LTR24_006353 [Lithohypha guttulata]KAK5315360.1 hypothetical protein LTR70_006791 [Exophiala xenobiotica]